MLWLQFLACAALITYTGAKLSRYADKISEITGLGHTWIGVVLLASVTSLPELITGTTAVALHQLPDIAAGDVLGSCMINIAIIAALDFIYRKEPILASGDRAHILNAAFGIALLAVANISLLLGNRVPSIGWIGIYTPILLAGYLLAVRMLFRMESGRDSETESGDEAEATRRASRKRVYLGFSIHALMIIAAATWLPKVGERIAEQTGLEQSFVGTLFIAWSTSLPEFVVTFTALRHGAVHLALGNLFGSNTFNLAILAIEDIAYTKGPLLEAVSRSHSVSSNAAILMTAIAVVGLVTRSKSQKLGFGLASIMLFIVYASGTAISYMMGLGSAEESQ
ncbi:MAG TPA: sodium:calcium antiporter [Verrucomicrobiae bacterium]|nr:sodium:calcium antiporter [Verrucomicrobiae bacterium]